MKKLALVFLLLAGGLGGCRTPAVAESRPPASRFFLESTNSRALTVQLPQSGVQIAVNPKPVFTEADVLAVELAQVSLGRCLLFQLSPAAGRDLYRISASQQGRRLVLMIDGDPVGARKIDGALTDGALFIFVELPDENLPGLVQRFKRNQASPQRTLGQRI